MIFDLVMNKVYTPIYTKSRPIHACAVSGLSFETMNNYVGID